MDQKLRPQRPRRPGELFIDRYMPNATEAEREEALKNLQDLIAILVRIDERLAREMKFESNRGSDT
jgi:hypothetical protein